MSTAQPLPLLVAGERAAYRESPQGPVRLGRLRDVIADLARLERERHPRWVVWSARAALAPLVTEGVPVARSWDVAEVHRVLCGGWGASPGRAVAHVRGLDVAGRARPGPQDLFSLVEADAGDDPDDPVRPDGHLRPLALDPDWLTTPARWERSVDLLASTAQGQQYLLAPLGRGVSTAHSESAAALLCLELERDGLPLDVAEAERLIAHAAGPRPRDAAHAAAIRHERDERVLRLASGRRADLRNPAQVKELLTACGVEVTSTRKWQLEPYRASHPIVAALLDWRRDERIATTYGYRWLDEHVGSDHRLRGPWTACDGAAGRMTAGAGLHNLPTALRPAVAARPGHVLVRADLGQIEPRVLAAVSGDPAFCAASRSDDLYAPVAQRLGVERAVAKIAVLAAMYGGRSGVAGQALERLQRAFPQAMALLDEAYAAGVARAPLRTFGGRLIPLGDAAGPATEGVPGSPGHDAARGRFARNAVIQGAAAELFKAWVATVRHAVRPLGGEVVLCLHDEVLVHVPQESGYEVADLLASCLADAARWWSGSDAVRFVADVRVVQRWSEAKD